jgi:ABC-2 type transport system permease protein
VNPKVIGALVLRYLFLYSRNAVRVVEVFFWPIMELMVWGYLTRYLYENGAGEMPIPITYLLGGVILWDVLFRAQQGVAISFLEDVWTRNLLNVFVAPVRSSEYLVAAFCIGFVRITVTVCVLVVLSILLYAFNIFELNVALIPFFANLMLFGWTLGIVSVSLILRWGQAAESLAWAVPFFVQPIAAVFYPVSVLPGWLQPVALSLPCTHIFEGMREVLQSGTINWSGVAWATALNVVFMAGAVLLFSSVLASVRRKGLLTRVTSH